MPSMWAFATSTPLPPARGRGSKLALVEAVEDVEGCPLRGGVDRNTDGPF